MNYQVSLNTKITSNRMQCTYYETHSNRQSHTKCKNSSQSL